MAAEDIDCLLRSQDKLEDAITKLTNISADINRMLAVHEHRISSQERYMEEVEQLLERRRTEIEIKVQEIYSTIKEEDRRILDELNKLRDELFRQHEIMELKMNQIEKTIWTYLGGFAVLTFILMYGGDILSLIKK